MKTRIRIIGTVVFVVFVVFPAVLVVRRFGPSLAEKGMKKCHEMMNRMAAESASEQSAPLASDGSGDRAPSDQGNRVGRPSLVANA